MQCRKVGTLAAIDQCAHDGILAIPRARLLGHEHVAAFRERAREMLNLRRFPGAIDAADRNEHVFAPSESDVALP
jgi:hypothetical protein